MCIQPHSQGLSTSRPREEERPGNEVDVRTRDFFPDSPTVSSSEIVGLSLLVCKWIELGLYQSTLISPVQNTLIL